METPQAVIPSPPASALFRFFDNPTYADTLFRIYGIEAEAPWPIFACKEMLIASSSHFTTRKSVLLRLIQAGNHNFPL